MTTAQVVLLGLKLSTILISFALGLKTTPTDWTWILRRPALLARSLLALNVLMPLFALGVIRVMHLRFPVVVALLAISLSPVPPFLPGKQEKAGGVAPYAVDLLAIASALSVIWIPLAVELDERVLGIPLEVSPWTVARIVAGIVLIPLLVGTIIGAFARARALCIAPMLSRAARIVLALAMLLILLRFWRAALGLIGDGTLAAFIGFVVAGLAVGHLLGGPDERGRAVLALASASRHPGIAATIARLNFPDERAVPAALLLYLVVSSLLSLPYIRWRKRRNGPSP